MITCTSGGSVFSAYYYVQPFWFGHRGIMTKVTQLRCFISHQICGVEQIWKYQSSGIKVHHPTPPHHHHHHHHTHTHTRTHTQQTHTRANNTHAHFYLEFALIAVSFQWNKRTFPPSSLDIVHVLAVDLPIMRSANVENRSGGTNKQSTMLSFHDNVMAIARQVTTVNTPCIMFPT